MFLLRNLCFNSDSNSEYTKALEDTLTAVIIHTVSDL